MQIKSNLTVRSVKRVVSAIALVSLAVVSAHAQAWVAAPFPAFPPGSQTGAVGPYSPELGPLAMVNGALKQTGGWGVGTGTFLVGRAYDWSTPPSTGVPFLHRVLAYAPYNIIQTAGNVHYEWSTGGPEAYTDTAKIIGGVSYTSFGSIVGLDGTLKPTLVWDANTTPPPPGYHQEYRVDSTVHSLASDAGNVPFIYVEWGFADALHSSLVSEGSGGGTLSAYYPISSTGVVNPNGAIPGTIAITTKEWSLVYIPTYTGQPVKAGVQGIMGGGSVVNVPN